MAMYLSTHIEPEYFYKFVELHGDYTYSFAFKYITSLKIYIFLIVQ